tara:strand:- start:3184 stop:3291 length:108 start_codon:yes stop_codon:yes gene_type:complete
LIENEEYEQAIEEINNEAYLSELDEVFEYSIAWIE